MSDVSAIRFMLSYIFASVRVARGRQTSRNPTIELLKSHVQTESVLRRVANEEFQVFTTTNITTATTTTTTTTTKYYYYYY